MQSSTAHYILRETIISVIINTALSCIFFFLQFHSLTSICWTGHGGLVRDSLPQTFAISLMSVLVPTLITRRRAIRETLPMPAIPRRITPSNVFLRAVGAAAMIAFCGFAATYVVCGHETSGISFRSALAFKCAYGAAIALIVTPLAVGMALHDVALGKK